MKNFITHAICYLMAGMRALAVVGCAQISLWGEEVGTEIGQDARGTLQSEKIPRPGAAPVIERNAILGARDRGVAFLLEHQNPNGSWGSARNTKGLNIMADIPGAHYAFTTAITALAIEALTLSAPPSEAVNDSLSRAETWLLEMLPRLKRSTDLELYNVWSHSYAIKALLVLHKRHEGNPEKQAVLLEAVRAQVKMLERYEYLEGGWGYYNFGLVTQKPNGDSNSFTTATGLIALHQAKQAGVEVPQKIVDNAVRSILLQRAPDGAYAYGLPFRNAPRRPINRPAGSLGRAPACNAALRLWTGDEHISDQDIEDWLDRLITRGGWLDLSRKRPIPHEAWFQNSGYFFYYGYYYAAHCTELLPEQKRPAYAAHLMAAILHLQETDGSWWDYPLYNYHQAYGTAYALTTLARLQPGLAGMVVEPESTKP